MKTSFRSIISGTFLAACILAVCILTLASCGSGGKKQFSYSGPGVSAQSQGRIINGTEISPADSPQIIKVLIRYADGGSALCSGTVISSDDVLTAGHCFEGEVASVTLSKPDGSITGTSQVTVHPGYFADLTLLAIFNDVAVVKAAEPLGLPALGIVAGHALGADSPIGIYGYGLDENGDFGTLRGGTMTVSNVSENHIFAVFDAQSNTCSGDSGGPATYSITGEDGNVVAVGIAGITSTGSVENCAKGDVNLFTNLQNPSILTFISDLVPDATFF